MDSKPIFDEIFQRVSKGNIISPRGSKVIEVENFMYELPPYVKFQNYDVRKLKFNYIKQELLWYLRHNVHDTSIVNFASIWKDLIQPNGTINSNYGAHLFASKNRETSQFLNVIDILRKDADSRRASMVILTDSHLLCDIDVPCTYSLNFRIRNNKLNMTVHMRSQDAIFGMGNEISNELHHKFLNQYNQLLLLPDMDLGGFLIYQNLVALLGQHKIDLLFPNDLADRLDNVVRVAEHNHLLRLKDIAIKHPQLASLINLITTKRKFIEQESYLC